MSRRSSLSSESARPLAALIGIDWADDHHDIALQACGSASIEESRLTHTPEALAAWLGQLGERFHQQPIGVALETSRGPLVHVLPWSKLFRAQRAVPPQVGALADACDGRTEASRKILKNQKSSRVWSDSREERGAFDSSDSSNS